MIIIYFCFKSFVWFEFFGYHLNWIIAFSFWLRSLCKLQLLSLLILVKFLCLLYLRQKYFTKLFVMWFSDSRFSTHFFFFGLSKPLLTQLTIDTPPSPDTFPLFRRSFTRTSKKLCPQILLDNWPHRLSSHRRGPTPALWVHRAQPNTVNTAPNVILKHICIAFHGFSFSYFIHIRYFPFRMRTSDHYLIAQSLLYEWLDGLFIWF